MMDTILLQPCVCCECDVPVLPESECQLSGKWKRTAKCVLQKAKKKLKATVKPTEKEDFTAAVFPGGRGGNKNNRQTHCT